MKYAISVVAAFAFSTIAFSAVAQQLELCAEVGDGMKG